MKNFLLLLSIMLFGLVHPGMSQTPTHIEGKVTDKSGLALPGVTIVNLQNKAGTITNIDGYFKINGEKGNKLKFSYVGMKTLVLTANKTSLSVTLEESSITLNEVVAIGYGTTTKKDLTGSVSSLKLEDSPLMSLPNNNVLESLKGSLPGVNIGMNTSAGGTPSFSIRGQNSISAGNAPLLVVDGIIGGNFSEINPHDIATIDILKDASSTAVYGSRAANGVIIITTKRGKTEKPRLNFSMNYGVQSWTRKPELMNGDQYLQFRKDYYISEGASGKDLEPEFFLRPKEWAAYQAGSEINWFDETTQNAIKQDYQVSVSGASDHFNYYLSTNYTNQEGLMIGDEFTRSSILAKLEANLSKHIKAGVNLSGSIRDYSGVTPDMYTATYIGPWGFLNSTEKGYEQWKERYPGGNTTWGNPLWNSFGVDNNDIRYIGRVKSFLKVQLPWIKGLSWTLNGSYDINQTKQANFVHEEHYVNTLKIAEMANPTAFLKNANGSSRSNNSHGWLVNQILNYNQTFNGHKIDLTFMSERQRSHSDGVYSSASDFEQAGTSVLGYNSLQLGNKDKRGVSTWKTQSSQLAYMGRLNYVFNEKYHFSASYRHDGYSAFSENFKYGDFKSAAVAWTISKEDFFKNNIVNYLKLRASYGENGNPSIGSYSTFPTVGTGGYIFGQEYKKSLYQNKLANKSLGWERTEALNFGVDFGLLKDRITGNVEYYNSITKDLLVTRRLPNTSGYGSILDNMGKISNWGLEVGIHTLNIKTRDFEWTTDLSFWLNRNKIDSLYGIDSDNDGKEDDDLGNRWFIGKSLGAVYDYTMDGIVQKEDKDYMEKYNAKPGDVKFRDINNDGKINSDDRSIIGYSKPNYNLNLRNTITYLDFQLYFSLNYINGGNSHYLSNNEKGFNPALMPSANWINEEYWTPEKPSNISPRANYRNSRGYGFYQSREFLRLQDITLSYNFSKKLLDKTNFFTQAKVFVSGKNLLTLTNWRGLDPEAGQRIGEGSPSFKTISLGLNVSF